MFAGANLCCALRHIQALLGHDKLDTTARYTGVATCTISGIESPRDLLSKPAGKTRKKKAVKVPISMVIVPYSMLDSRGTAEMGLTPAYATNVP